MKHELEIFFDYTCPYCFRAHKNLTELISDYPDVDIVWHPCEAHPRPESYGPHSDLCIQGYFYALDNGVDIWAYHDRMYQATMKEHIDIENIDVLSEYVGDLVNADAFRFALQQGSYRSALDEVNELAYEKSGVWAVPAYRMEERKLDAIENIGVTKEELRLFMDKME